MRSECWRGDCRLPGPPNRRATHQLRPHLHYWSRPRIFLVLLQGWAEARACLQKTSGRGGAGLLLLLLLIGSGTANRPHPHARLTQSTKSGVLDLPRLHERLLLLTTSGSAAETRPCATARFPTRFAHARKHPSRLCDVSPAASLLLVASADPSGSAGGRCPPALVLPGPAALGPPPAPAAAEPPPPPLLGPPETVVSAPAREETARGDVSGGHAHRTGLL